MDHTMTVCQVKLISKGGKDAIVKFIKHFFFIIPPPKKKKKKEMGGIQVDWETFFPVISMAKGVPINLNSPYFKDIECECYYASRRKQKAPEKHVHIQMTLLKLQLNMSTE